VQGALSLWSYCSDIPHAQGKPGYFHQIIETGKVSGPIVTTQSRLDTAVGSIYPLAAGIARQVDFPVGEFPKYGGVGAFGAQGPGIQIQDQRMKPANEGYGFQGGTVYNLESSQFIKEGGGASGAHSDIAKPEVAHAFWEAAMT
jgi:hypothetical protein